MAIKFFIDEENYCEIPLTGNTIEMIKNFDIKPENPDALEYIVNHKEDAFKKYI